MAESTPPRWSDQPLDEALRDLVYCVFTVLASRAWVWFCAEHAEPVVRMRQFFTLLCDGYTATPNFYLLHFSSGLDRTFAATGHPLIHVGTHTPRMPGAPFVVAWRLGLYDRTYVHDPSYAADAYTGDGQRFEKRLATRFIDEVCFVFEAFGAVEAEPYDTIKHEDSALRIDRVRWVEVPEWGDPDIAQLSKWAEEFDTSDDSFLWESTVAVRPTLRWGTGADFGLEVDALRQACFAPCAHYRELIESVPHFAQPVEDDVNGEHPPAAIPLSEFLAAMRPPPASTNHPGRLYRIDWERLEALVGVEAFGYAEMLAQIYSVRARYEFLAEKFPPGAETRAPQTPLEATTSQDERAETDEERRFRLELLSEVLHGELRGERAKAMRILSEFEAAASRAIIPRVPPVVWSTFRKLIRSETLDPKAVVAAFVASESTRQFEVFCVREFLR